MALKDINTEQKIVEAAKTVFMKYGLYGSRMQEIADEAGINKALLHYYFRSKEKLFDYVFEGALTRYFEQMSVLSDTSKPVLERILLYIDRVIDFFDEYPQMSTFIVKEIGINPELFQEKVKAIKKDSNKSLIAILNEGMQKGEIPEMDAIIFMINLHSLCAYPFIAKPIFNAIITKNNLIWEDPKNEKLKESVKNFVKHHLNHP